MLNLKSTNPIQRLQPLQKMIKTVKIFKKRTRQSLIPLHYYLLGAYYCHQLRSQVMHRWLQIQAMVILLI